MIKSITIDCRMFFASGIGRYLQCLLPILIAKYGEHQFFLLGDKVILEEYFNQNSIKLDNVQIISFTASIYSVREQKEYPSIIPDCDLFWSPHFNIPILHIKAKRRLVTIHDAYHLAFKSSLSLKENIYASIVYRLALAKSDSVITVSNFSKEELVQRVSSKYSSKIKVIHNGVKPFESHNGVVEENIISGKYLLFVGNVKPHKNLKNALLGYEKFILENSQSELKFVIVGKKDGFINGDHTIAELITKNPNIEDKVIFTGFVSDNQLVELYKNAMAFIFPSIYEGFGLPPLEAMQYGTAVLSSNAACLPEVCGNAALYFDPLNIQDIADKINLIINNDELREQLIQLGTKHIFQFTWNDASHKHIEIIDNLLN